MRAGVEEKDWLGKRSPREWIQAALDELGRARAAYAKNDPRGGLAFAKRAAGMALNGALSVEPNDAWGRSYVDHIAALLRDVTAPQAVRDACSLLMSAEAPGSRTLTLRSKAGTDRILEAATDVMAHAYAKVKKHGTEESS